MDRVPSDHETVETVRVRLVAHGPKTAVAVPTSVSVPTDDLVRVAIDGTTYHGQFEDFADGPRLTGLFDTPTVARAPGDGTNRLQEWLSDLDQSRGQSLQLDIIESGFKYGLREPGERAIYDAPTPPDDGLASIARDLDE